VEVHVEPQRRVAALHDAHRGDGTVALVLEPLDLCAASPRSSRRPGFVWCQRAPRSPQKRGFKSALRADRGASCTGGFT
jgi:hypothetical protein